MRLCHRISPLAALYRFARPTVGLALTLALGFGAYRFLTLSNQAGALEFTPHAVSVVGGAKGVRGVASGDMDGDGDVDIVTAGNDGIRVYENTGDKTFAASKLIDPLPGRRVQVIDIDKDGLPDILVTLDHDPSVKWYRNSGGLEFDGAFIGTGKDGQAFAADINQDQLPDVVAAADNGGTFTILGWINNGSGGFTASILFPSTGNPSITALTVGVLNKHSYPDVVVSGSAGLQTFHTADGVTWNRSDIDDSEQNATHVVIADVTGDGITDVVTGSQADDKLLLYTFFEDNQFQKATLNPAVDATTIVVRDLDEDGDEDIIVTGQDNDSVYWYDNNGQNEFTQRTLADDLSAVFGVAVADFDNDGDLDFATSDYTRGTVWWYERTRAKPVATAPSTIKQTVDGAGRITFDTTVSDGDFDATSLRVQYSIDGDHWYKPWLVKVTASRGSTDLTNSNAYQVGSSNVIDTNANQSVKLTLVWDTKSSGNTGGPINGDINTVQLRVLPRDSRSLGAAAVSKSFRVDNQQPQGLANVRATNTDSNEVTISWNRPTDSSAFTYKLYYGTDHAKVLEQLSLVWDATDDATMNDIETSSATVTGLKPGTTYTFKLFVTDAFGNQAAAPSIRAATFKASTGMPSPTPFLPTPTGFFGTPTPIPSTSFTPTPTEFPTGEPTTTPIFPVQSASPTPRPTLPSTTFGNTAPVADAGLDQVVNPSALVVLDAAASSDSDGEPLTYAWRQLAGPAVQLLSERTANPSFSAGGEGETYIFALTVRDQVGASSTDAVTVAVKSLPPAQTIPVETGQAAASIEPVTESSATANPILAWLDLALFAISLALTLISLTERTVARFRNRSQGLPAPSTGVSTGKVVHFRTNEPIADAFVLVYGADGKLRSRERTNSQGEFGTLFPAGEYTLSVQADNFVFAPAAFPVTAPDQGIIYSGGKITIPPGGRPTSIVIPMKPVGREVSTLHSQWLHIWQTTQRLGRLLSWPVFIVGSLLNTALIFWVPSGLFLVIEILYVFLVIIKVALEVRVRPAYGFVRDSITHVPIDLAVVRLFEGGTNRLVMTRVTDSQGKFFALPPSGTYTITITKGGYAIFSKDQVRITSEHDSVLQMTADLMPVAPMTGLAQARAAVL